MNQANQKSGFGSIVLILLGMGFLIGPMFIPAGILAGGSKLMISGMGIVMLVIGAILYLLTKLYIKTPSNLAYVRTGMGGKKVIIDGGAVYIPMFHELMPILTETMKIIVIRSGPEALLTKDKLRADVTSEFFIKVEKNAESVIAAATSLGNKGTDESAVKKLVEEKLVSALRSVAAQLDLEELNADRQGFADKVQALVAKDLSQNGLTLETTTCSKLDQADYQNINLNNVFDAQGAKTVAEKTQQAIVARNQIEKEAKVQIAAKDLETTKQINELRVNEEKSTAERDKAVIMLQAENTAEARIKSAQQDKLAKEAEILTEQEIAVKEKEKEKAVAAAEVDKNKAVELANIEKEQTIAVKSQEKAKAEEIAMVDKEKAVLEKAAEKALADKKKSEAEKQAAEASQAVLTVNAVKSAERDQEVTVVKEKAIAETIKIKENANTDIEAYKTTTIAKAKKEAAVNSAEATTVEAEASLKAKKFEAEGETAVQMVPVNVAKAQVDVNAQQVEVTGKELKYKSEFSQVSITLETNLANIAASKEVGIAFANGLATAFSNANMNIWGDGNTATQMIKMFSEGQGQHIKLQALGNGGNQNNQVREDAKQLIASYLEGTKTAMEVMGASDNVSSEVKSLVQEFVKSGGGNTMAGIALMVKFLTGKEASKDDYEKLEALVAKVSE